VAQRFLRSHKGDLHFITFCCYQCRRFLATAPARNIALQVLREVRARYDFALIGYVFMPDHVHLLVSEPTAVPTATVIASLQTARVAPDARKETQSLGIVAAAIRRRRGPTAPVLAPTLFRFQCLFPEESDREASLHACESRKRETGAPSWRLAME
jgi:Transposase IS200 like